MRIISYFFLLCLVILGVTFAALNAKIITVNYYFGIKHFPLSLLLVATFSAGALWGLFVGFIACFTKRHKIWQKKNDIT